MGLFEVGPGASTSITPPDADGDAPGHQVNVAEAEEVRITITVTAQDGTVKKYTVTIHSPICGDSPWGRAVVDRPNCVLLNSLIVSVADGYTVEYASRELAKLPGWTARTRLSFLRMIGAEYSPDNLSLEQLYAERDTIAEFPWARRVGRNTMASVLAGVQGTPSENHAATGQPTTNGTAQVGETLTASTSGIADADGLTNAAFSYQWIRNDGSTDTDIQDATASTYTLKGADEGKVIKVRVSFSDDGGNDETLTSAATSAVAAAPNAPATGAPTIGGTAQVGETLTVDTTAIADDDGLDNAAFAYQWVANDGSADEAIQDATASTYTLKAADEGKTIKVRVSFSDDGGNDESLTSAATATVSASVPGAPGAVDIQPAGTGKLSVSWQEPVSNGGSSITAYTVQWKELSDSWDTTADVSSTTTTTTTTSHTIGRLSLDTEYSVRVIAGNSVGDGPASAEETATAVAQTSQQQAATQNNPATGAPAINGTPEVGQTLSVDTSSISDADGLANVAFSYQWVRNDGGTDTDLLGQTASIYTFYTLVDADLGKTIKVRVFFTDDADNEETLTSAATAAVAAAANTPVTGAPTISDPQAYVTVEIKDGDDTVSWSDPGNCSSDYNLYLAVTPPDNDAETARTHLGSAASGSDESTQAISHEIPVSLSGVSSVPRVVEVELYCGEYEASSLVSSTRLAMGPFNLREGTYSSAPLTALTINSGTLSPSFDRGIYRYSAEVPSDTEAITLEPDVLTGFFTVFVKNPVWGIVSSCWGGPLRGTCNYGYGDGTTTGIILNDAGEDKDGFQIDLGRGENRLGIGVNTGNVDTGPGELYYLTITVQNSPRHGIAHHQRHGAVG